jgi:putative FmdB family regulatory protein
MPIYEYACHGCRKKVSIFQRSMTTATAVRCPECGSERLERLISKFSFHRSMPDFDDGPDLDDDSVFGDVDENDPRSVARWARRMGEQMGEDLPPDFEEQIARMEAGEMPDEDGLGDGGFDDFGDED